MKTVISSPSPPPPPTHPTPSHTHQPPTYLVKYCKTILPRTIYFLHILFNVCFKKGTVPTIRGKCIINPFPKSSSRDPRDPLSYRGNALASSVYKIYCSVINERLSRWAEDNDKVTDEQNCCRRKRSTIDHVSSFTSSTETRKKLKKSTFCAFIDFKKAYDSINRENYGSGCLKSVSQENNLRI